MSKFDKFTKIFFWTSTTAAMVMAVILAGFDTSAPASENVPQQSVKTITTLFFAGDIMLSRNVAGKIFQADDNALPFRIVAEEIKSADISFANLESPFLDEGPYAQQGFSFKAAPEAVEGLILSGFDVLSTANNHAYDQGREGVDYTLSWLAGRGIAPVGTGTDCREGVVLEKNGIKFGILAYSYAAYNDGGWKKDPIVCDWKDGKAAAIDVKNLKSRADFVIVSGHMGTEYQRQPDQVDVERVHSVMDAGADLFIGHHPHWIQTIEQYQGKWIFYSLGNFVFDQMWSEDTQQGLTALITFEDRELSKIELKPVVIEDYCCPRWTNFQETASILSKIDLTSPILMDKN